MTNITNLTNDAQQSMILIGEAGEEIDFSLYYSDNMQGWYYNLTYGTTTINGARLCNSPNLLRQWKNIFAFGLSRGVTDGGEPNFQDDFTSGRVTLSILSATDVAYVETAVLLI